MKFGTTKFARRPNATRRCILVEPASLPTG